MSHSRPLLMPWLKEQINSLKYPGVAWTNPEQTEFSIPWKHALRQDSSNTDILIFKAWAEVSGNGRAHGEPSVWKRNFRSALRAKGFKMVSDNKNDAANPHKMFRWPDESGSKANSSLSPVQPCPDLFDEYPLPIQESQPILEDYIHLPHNVYSDPVGSHDILQECLNRLDIGPGPEGFEPPPEQQHLLDQDVIGGHVLRGQQEYPVSCEGAVDETGLPGQPTQPIEGAVGGAYDEQRAEQFLHTINQTDDGSHFKTEFRVKVFYRGRLVCDQLVQNESGVRIVYRPDLVAGLVDPDSGLSLLSLPIPENMIDQTQANLTQRILNKLGDGLDVGVSGHVVYGQRHGECKAFWSFSKFDQSRQPQEVSKEPRPLYMFKDFVRGIVQFINGKDSPPCSMFFCLGERWPDPDNKPWNKKLITVEVVLTSMELLKKMAVDGGASSLQSVDLQISLEEMMELY